MEGEPKMTDPGVLALLVVLLYLLGVLTILWVWSLERKIKSLERRVERAEDAMMRH